MMKAPMEDSTLSCEPTFSMGVGLFTPNLLRGATMSCKGSIYHQQSLSWQLQFGMQTTSLQWRSCTPPHA